MFGKGKIGTKAQRILKGRGELFCFFSLYFLAVFCQTTYLLVLFCFSL